jgi:hypothetical protein
MENITLETINKLFEANMLIDIKRIYPFHLKIAFDCIKELKTNKKVICPGFIRQIIYKILDNFSIKYNLEIIGYKKIRSLNRWYGRCNRRRLFFTPGTILGWIRIEKIQMDELIELKNRHQNNIPFDKYSIDEIKLMFDLNVSEKEKLELINRCMNDKWTIFDYIHLHKPIKQINLIE